MTELERAYVFPSAVDIFGFANDIPQNLQFSIRMRSLGRTPAVIKEVAIKFNGTTPLTGKPDITGAINQEFDWVIDETSLTEPFRSPHIGAQYWFGYIRYLDIFNKEHYSWLGVYFDPALGPPTGMVRAGGDPYNSWD